MIPSDHPAASSAAQQTHQIRRYRCDDAAGFELRILRAPDCDFHLSVVPHRPDFDREHEGAEDLFAGCYSASVRIRMPMIGGGAHEDLYHALARLFNPDAYSVVASSDAQLAEARATIVRLNRRCQSAESGLAAKLESGPSFGRALANAAATMYYDQLKEANAEIARLRAQLAAMEPAQ